MTFVLGVLLKYWRLTLAAACIVILAVVFAVWRRGLVNRGVAVERSRVADSTLAIVTPQRIKAETTLVRDIRTVTRLVVKHDTVERWRHDTVYVTGDTTARLAVPVVEMARLDTLERACSDLSVSCAQFRASATTELAALRAKLAAVPVAKARSCIMQSILVGALGVGAGYLAHRP